MDDFGGSVINKDWLCCVACYICLLSGMHPLLFSLIMAKVNKDEMKMKPAGEK